MAKTRVVAGVRKRVDKFRMCFEGSVDKTSHGLNVEHERKKRSQR